MVAYRFNMHREVALSFTASAELQIRKLLKKGLGTNVAMLYALNESYYNTEVVGNEMKLRALCLLCFSHCT